VRAEKAEINAPAKKNPKSVQLQFESILHFPSRSPPWAFQLHTETHFSQCIYMFTLSRPSRVLLCSVFEHTAPFLACAFHPKKKRLSSHINSSDCGVSLSLRLDYIKEWMEKGLLAVESVLLMPLCHHLRAAGLATDEPRFAQRASRACESWCKNSGSPTNSWPMSRYKCTNEIIMTPLLCRERAHPNSSVACASYMQIFTIPLFWAIKIRTQQAINLFLRGH
jgi:hypothetical protein